jgi:predicted RNase H-like HicB family nuclease
VPDLAGCVAAGINIEDVAENIHDSIALHSEMMNEQGEDVLVLSSQVIRVDVAS